MTTFEDGPAKGQTLMLQRAPLFLRVVIDPSGKVDALDQLTDKPASNEKIFAYVLTAEPGRFHIYNAAAAAVGTRSVIISRSFRSRSIRDAEQRALARLDLPATHPGGAGAVCSSARSSEMNNSAAWTLPDHQKRVLAIGDARRRGILRRMSPQFFALLFCAIGVWIAASAVGAAGAQLLSGSYRPVSTTQNNQKPVRDSAPA
jgi:hypothetical protein